MWKKSVVYGSILTAVLACFGISPFYPACKFMSEADRASASDMLFPASYDIRGTITDADGNPLKGVCLDKTYEIFGTTHPTINSRQTVDSEFHIEGNNSPFLELKFSKKGYYPEKLSFEIGNTPLQKELQIKMRPSEQTGISEFLTFRYEEKQKYTCDLSNLEKGTVQAQFVDLTTKTEMNHLEIGFKRNEKGEIVFNESQSSSYPEPAAFVISLRSDAPDDGLIVTEASDDDNSFAKALKSLWDEEASKKRNDRWMIPETGYDTKEIVLDLTSGKKNFVVFLKCGGFFGKAELSLSVPFSKLGLDKERAFLKFELDINKEKGYRRLLKELKDDFIPRSSY